MAELLLPSLGADKTAGTLVAWKIKPGDVVVRGQVVAEVETDKGVIDIECFDPGAVEKIVARPGEKLPVGAVLAVIRSEQAAPKEEQAAESSPRPVTTSGAVATSTRVEASAPTVSSPAPSRTRATPAARKRAAELGIDLDRLKPADADAAIELADVERFAASNDSRAPAPPSPQPEDSRDRMRRAIAAAMSKSKREIPHYYLRTTIEMTRALAWLEVANRNRTIAERLLPAVLQIKAAALALRDVPELNGFWVDDAPRAAGGIHVGLAIAMKGGGLAAPAVHDTDCKSLDELMAHLHDLIPRARAGRLRSSEMTDATVTLTNLGDLGVEEVFGVIYPPQVAIIGFGKISQQPWAENGAVCVRPLLVATLAADHRATDGRRGAQFLEALNRRLQAPEQL